MTLATATKTEPDATATPPIPFGRPMIGPEERAAVARVLEGTTLTHGPLVQQFEADFAAFTGAPHTVATASCAAALQLGALALDIGPGDEVIVSAQTHVATAHAIEMCGARCVFADSEPTTGNVDPAAIRAAITPHTIAIALVHYLGTPADMPAIMDIARRHRLAVIEDCALAPGARVAGLHVGLLGDLGCYSFYPAKHITTGEGGMLITRRAEVAERVRRLRAFGIDRDVVAERPVPGLYDVVQLGLNYRMSEMAAAMGIEQLRKLPGFLTKRREHDARLRELLAGIDGVQVVGSAAAAQLGIECACYCLSILLDPSLRERRTDLIHALRARGIGTSIYYPQPVPRMSYYRNKYAVDPATYATAALLSDATIALPVGPHLSAGDIDRIAAAVEQAIGEIRS